MSAAGRRRFFSRRRVLAGLGLGAAGLVGARYFLPWWWRARPIVPLAELSSGARELVDAAFADLDPAAVWDMHTHLVGYGSGDGGEGWVNPEMEDHLAVTRRLQFDVYLNASGVTDLERAGEQYLARLGALHRAGFPTGRLMLLAFDYHVNEAGAVVRELSTFHVPNERVLELSRADERLEAVVSIHPYRADAVERLERAIAAGARAVKWLPNAMGIDPASSRCDAFYERLAASPLVLLSHAGIERAVHAPEDQELGNPLRLRRALDAGVRVVVAHCGSLGRSLDLDAQAAGASEESFELFLRMMAESRYEGLLFGDLSAVLLVNRPPDVLGRLLAAEGLHERLVYGSDYPLPAIDPIVSTRQLAWRGVVDGAERAPLEELFRANPLLFHFVLLRRVRSGQGAAARRFLPRAFETARLFA